MKKLVICLSLLVGLLYTTPVHAESVSVDIQTVGTNYQTSGTGAGTSEVIPPAEPKPGSDEPELFPEED